MDWLKDSFIIQTRGKGLYPATAEIRSVLENWGVREGMVHLFISHTSASLVISESYDPTARQDLEEFMEHLVPEGEPWYRHTLEGRDDSPSHMRAMLTSTSLCIPIDDGKLNLGTWQGVYVFEHRASSHRRKILVRCLKTA